MVRRIVVLVLVLAAVGIPARAASVPQDDAGSGRDAPNTPVPGVSIEPGVVYAGTILGIPLDQSDYYEFHANQGSVVEAVASGVLGCTYIADASGKTLASSCVTVTAQLVPLQVRVPATGSYFFGYSYIQPDRYTFSIGLDAPAPDPSPTARALIGVGGSLPTVTTATESGAHTVIAVVDTGVNLYHRFFRAPALVDPPSTWLPDFPASAVPVHLSLDAAKYSGAVSADSDLLNSLQRTTYNTSTKTFDEHLYTFPGTRIVGAVSFSEYIDTTAPSPTAYPVLDDFGHGTHSSGLALGADLPQADGNVLLVMVEVGKSDFGNGILWAARQPYIDAISVSLGTVANVGAPGLISVAGATREATRAGKPVFVASGNGFSNSGIAPDHCTTYTSGYSGPAWVTRIGAADPASGNPTWWHCVPVDAIAATNIVSADYADLDAGTSASGTSASTPNASGAFAQVLLGARRLGASLSAQQVLEHVLHAAQPVAYSPGLNRDPALGPVSLAVQGYGLIDGAAAQRALAQIVDGAPPQARPETTAWFEQDQAIRGSIWGS